MKKQLYAWEVQEVPTADEMEGCLTEINYCEFCNNGHFVLGLKEFQLKEDGKTAVAVVEVNADGEIEGKMTEMLYCEFCYANLNLISVQPLP